MTGDFNHNGHLDLTVGVFNIYPSNQIAVYLGDGSFSLGSNVFVPDVQGLVAADLNQDGNLDLAASTYGFNSVVFAVGDGTGGFASLITRCIRSRGSHPCGIARGRFQRCRSDVVIAKHSNGAASVVLSVACQD